MKKHLISLSLGAALLMSACATNNTKTTTNKFAAPESSKTLMVRPDVELSVLMATGMTEIRADWSQAGTENLAAALEAALRERSSEMSVMENFDNLNSDQLQIIKLNDAVVQMALAHDYGLVKLPTNKDQFNRTLGPNAIRLRGASGADYALMVRARGSFQSAGKIAMNVAMAALGGGIQTGSTQLFATLVDLETGDIVWSNLATAATGVDMRKPEGAQTIVKSLLKDFPL